MKKIYKTNYKSNINNRSLKQDAFFHPIPVFDLNIDEFNRCIILKLNTKQDIIFFKDIKNTYIGLSYGLQPLGVTQNIEYYIDLYIVIIDNEEYVLEFLSYSCLKKLVLDLTKYNININDPMDIVPVINDSIDPIKRKQIIELLKNRISEFENDEKLVEKNRRKNKYERRF
ncbi:hypothetical protein DWV83_12030 [Coprobacillus sp. AF13-15]|nr:hypothetical protein DWV95_11755 [Coprobacillus sp. AF13-4LB]RHS14661.1 hypothetical protein DWV83_12030 [Coprobacillus sp. AF13-15]